MKEKNHEAQDESRNRYSYPQQLQSQDFTTGSHQDQFWSTLLHNDASALLYNFGRVKLLQILGLPALTSRELKTRLA